VYVQPEVGVELVALGTIAGAVVSLGTGGVRRGSARRISDRVARIAARLRSGIRIGLRAIAEGDAHVVVVAVLVTVCHGAILLGS
jgi:hypothetical protein